MIYPPLKFTFSGGPYDGQEFKLPPNAPKVRGGLWMDPEPLLQPGAVFNMNTSRLVEVEVDGKKERKRVLTAAQYQIAFNEQEQTYSATFIPAK